MTASVCRDLVYETDYITKHLFIPSVSRMVHNGNMTRFLVLEVTQNLHQWLIGSVIIKRNYLCTV